LTHPSSLPGGDDNKEREGLREREKEEMKNDEWGEVRSQRVAE